MHLGSLDKLGGLSVFFIPSTLELLACLSPQPCSTSPGAGRGGYKLQVLSLERMKSTNKLTNISIKASCSFSSVYFHGFPMEIPVLTSARLP